MISVIDLLECKNDVLVFRSIEIKSIYLQKKKFCFSIMIVVIIISKRCICYQYIMFDSISGFICIYIYNKLSIIDSSRQALPFICQTDTVARKRTTNIITIIKIKYIYTNDFLKTTLTNEVSMYNLFFLLLSIISIIDIGMCKFYSVKFKRIIFF